MKKAILPTLLAVSLLGNIFLQVVAWQKAWLAQIMTTSDIERLYRKSGADTSFQAIQTIAKDAFVSSFKVAPLDPADKVFMDPDSEVIIIGESKLFLKTHST